MTDVAAHDRPRVEADPHLEARPEAGASHPGVEARQTDLDHLARGGERSIRVVLQLDRRTEEFARRLMDQQIDPRRANIDWDAFRDSQRDASRDSVKSALALDEIARREGLRATDADLEKDVAQYAERSGLTPAAVRAQLEKEGALSRLSAGVRREKAMDFILSKAQVTRD